jgi:hypothetical protein
MSVSALSARARRGKTRFGRFPSVSTDRSPWEWYAESCSCGLAPGECREHPRARASQRAPAGDWRVWAYVAGRGAGKTRAGDLIDALRGGIRDAFPTGLVPRADFRHVHASRVMG